MCRAFFNQQLFRIIINYWMNKATFGDNTTYVIQLSSC